jgi:MFS transporter, FHS family, L-fucose permease
MSASVPGSSADRTQVTAFVAVTTLFFSWGFITSMNDPLIPAVRGIFQLSYAQSLLTQFAFFIAYGIVSIPAGGVVAKIGYSRAIVGALGCMIVGCLCIPLATHLQSYAVVLAALFIIASGMTVLQVAANPLSAALGTTRRSHFRLTLSQAFNSLGTVLGPWLGASIMLTGGIFAQADTTGLAAAARRSETLQSIDRAYFLMAGLLALLIFFIWSMRNRLNRAAPLVSARDSSAAALRSSWALLGAAAIFLYVGAEVSIASLMINFLHQPDVLDVSLERAGTLLGLFYWGGAMVGRFTGSFLLTRVAAPRLLATAASAAALLCLAVNQGSGATAAVGALSVGLFNSIMFPVIFTVTLERSTASIASTSGLLCTAIVGGALLPPLAGRIADVADLHAAFLVPMAAYALIALFAIKAALPAAEAKRAEPQWSRNRDSSANAGRE